MRHSSTELSNMFFSDLKKFNSTNFKTVASADLSVECPTVHKSFSATITRYFIFAEKHLDISDEELKMLYYKLKLDMVARYFATYPASNLDDLKPFQQELTHYIDIKSKEVEDEHISDSYAS